MPDSSTQNRPDTGKKHGGPGPQSQDKSKKHHTAMNVAENERFASAAVGGALILLGLKRRSIPGAMLGVIGGLLIRRGATGYCPVYSAMDVDTANEHHD